LLIEYLACEAPLANELRELVEVGGRVFVVCIWNKRPHLQSVKKVDLAGVAVDG